MIPWSRPLPVLPGWRAPLVRISSDFETRWFLLRSGACAGSKILAVNGVLLEFLAECRVGDPDEGPGPFPDRLSEEVGHPVFGHDKVHVAARGGHARPFGQAGDDPRVGSLFRGGRKGEDRFSPLAPAGAADEG